MQERVLIVTGGLVDPRDGSPFRVARKWLMQWRAAEAAWLDLKVKLVMAEPLLGMKLGSIRLMLRNDRRWRSSRSLLTGAAGAEPPPLTEVVLATLLHRARMPYEVLDLGALFSRPAEARKKLRRATCIFLSSTYLHDLSELEPILHKLKRPHNRIVLGGALAGILAHAWEGAREVDVVAVGYGELLVERLVEWIRSGYSTLRPPETGRIEARRHSAFLYSGVPATTNLDFLPTPDWDLATRHHRKRFRTIYYESVRGCPYRCNFCNYPYLFDDAKFRYKSAQRIVDDWERCAGELGVEHITCLDSLFTMPPQRLREVCRLLIERRVKVRWTCYARADDLADERITAMMKEAGAGLVQIGIESGDSGLLQNMDKACTVEANRLALQNCRKHGLTSVISLIVGFPGETPQTLERTYRFLKTSPPDFYFLATFSVRVAGVPLLQPANMRRFGLRVAENFRSMAPYWQHDTMSCHEAVNHVRQLDGRLMRNRVALSAVLFYPAMLAYTQEQREALLDLQLRLVEGHPFLRTGFDLANRWVDRKLSRDVGERFAEGGRSPARPMPADLRPE